MYIDFCFIRQLNEIERSRDLIYRTKQRLLQLHFFHLNYNKSNQKADLLKSLKSIEFQIYEYFIAGKEFYNKNLKNIDRI